MKNYIEIRPHHFLCLPGYKGYGYNKEHISSWDKVSKLVSQYPDIRVKIVSGQDTLCKNCNNNKHQEQTCNEKVLRVLDEKVKHLLNLKEGAFYTYKEIVTNLKQMLNPDKHLKLCGDCQWRSYGLCNDTFNKSKEQVPTDHLEQQLFAVL